jgi:hypothetical protein
MIGSLAYLLASCKSNRQSSDNYVFSSSKYSKCWDCETIKVNEFVLHGSI